MPLHGKIVVIKRSGGDGTEFPLTASCLFGRKVDCDIRIQLPQVSKEHCRIDLNENKELILTNLSSVNPTRVNGEVMQQSERLKHGDVITIIDRSFRFEYPPAPTPKKRRSSTASKTETLQVLQDQQVRDAAAGDAGDKRISEVSTDLYLKDGANSDNIQRPLENTVEVETKEDRSLPQSQTSSPFGELYQMIKQTLDAKTPRKSSLSQPQTPASRFYTPNPESTRKVEGKPVVSTEVKSTPVNVEAEVSSAAQGSAGVENKSVETPKSGKKQRRSSQVPSSEMTGLVAEENKPTEQAAKSAATPPRQRLSATPQRFTVREVVDQISAEKPKTPTRRRSKETTPVKPSVSKGEEEQPKVTEVQQTTPKTEISRRTSPRSSQKKLKVQDVAAAANDKQQMVKKRKSGELAADLPAPQVKKKRVSFGGHLSPELFDKRLPPDSPLCKGATPRRSLSLAKPKQSLLRRASVIGLIKEFENEHASPAKAKTPSPKKSPKARSPSPKTPSPGKKSPKARTPSPKTPSSEKKSPKAKTPSPKTPASEKKSPKARTPSPKTPASEKKSPKARTPSPKTPSSEKKSPKARSPSPKSSEVKRSPGKQSSASAKTPSPARGRSPSSGKSNTPKAEKSVTPVRSHTPTAVCVTPAKSPLSLEKQTPTTQGRFSVSRISTPSPITEQDVADPAPSVPATPKLPLRRKSMKSSSKKSAAEAMRRRSGVSRASLKAKNSWVDIVKFGQKKSQVVAPVKKTLTTKTKKVAAPKPQTPARRLMDYVSTGHADSPVTIVVGRAHKRTVAQPTGAAPRLVHNTALLKKNMKMDEDYTGIAEIFKTPVNARQRKSVISEQTVTKTPQGALGTTMIEASVLNTPEETGEMMVSPLSVASTVKCTTYNSEAVHRLLQGEEESSFVSEVPDLEISTDGSAEQLKTSVTTPKQKPVQPESLTGVKRIMKAPRQKAEPVDDLRGKLLKTPKQKPEQHECLTGVKRIMKTPRLKAEPVEDLHGKLLKTPKQKPEQHECLTGVKRIMKTPKQKAEPVEDLRGKLLKTPKAPTAAEVDYDGIQELLETPKPQPVEDLAEVTATKTPDVKSSPLVCATGIKRLMRTPKEKNAPVEDMEGVKRLMKTPKAKGEPVEANFGIKRLMRSPRLRGNAPVEDFEGLQELMEEPCSPQPETNEEMETPNQDETPLDCGSAIEEAEVPCEEQQEDVPRVQSENGPSEDVEDVPQADMVKEADVEEVPCAHHEEPSETMEIAPEAAIDQSLPEEQPEVQTATCEVTEMDTASIAPDAQKKSTRGRRAKVVEASEPLEETAVPAPVRGRRVRKAESAPSPAVRQSARSRKAQSNEGKEADLTVEVSDPVEPTEKVAPKPKRGRNAKKVSVDQAEVVSEVAVEAEVVPEVAVEVVSDQIPPTNAIHEEHDSVTPVEEADLKPKRGRRAKPESAKRAQKAPEKTEVVSDQPQPEEPSPIEAQSEEPVPVDALPVPTVSVEKPRRGRKTKQDSIEQNEMAEAPVRAKRGRNAKSEEEEKVEVPVVETTESQEPIEKSKRTRKAKQNPVEPKEVDMVEDPVKEKVEAPPVATKARRTRMTKQDSAESVEMPVESATLAESVEPAEKPRRGRKAKQDPEHVTPIESTEVQEKPSANPTEKPKRGRRAKQEKVIEEAEIITEVAEEKAEPNQEVEENRDDTDSSSALADQQPDAPVIKPTRGRGVKSAVKNEVSQATPAKRARRGAAPSLQEAAVPEAAVISKPGSRGRAGKLSKADTADEPAEVSVEPARKGRKAATKPTIDDTVVSSNEVVNAEPEVNKGKVSRRGKAASAARSGKANATEDVNNAVVEDMTVSKKSVNWKDDLAVTYDITTPTPVAKAARGRKTKLGDQDEASQGTPTKRSRRNPEPTVPPTTETATVPENKRKASRNAKKAEEEDLSGKAVVSEPVKKTRRGVKAADTASVEAPTQGAEEVESTPKVPAKRRVNAKKAVAVDSVEAVEPETQPKPRRGRAAKK